MATVRQEFSINRGTDYRLRFRLLQEAHPELGAIADWNVRFELRESRGSTTVLTVNGVLSGAVPDADLFGVWDVLLPSAQTSGLTKRTYFYAFRRIDVGFVEVLAKGKMFVETY